MPDAAASPGPSGMRARVRWAVGMLGIACLFWGLSFPLMQFAMEAFARVARAHGGERAAADADLAMRGMLNGWRFAIAAACYAAFSLRHQISLNRRDALAGVTVGLFFSGGIFLQLAGLRYTLPSLSSMLTSLVVVFTPFAQALLWKQRVSRALWIATVIALAGIAVLAMPNPAAVAENTVAVAPPWPLAGELLTVGCAVLFTGQILALDRLGAGADPWRLTFAMFVATAVSSFALAVLLGGGWLFHADVLLSLVRDPSFLWSMIAMILLSSVLAFHLMNAWQPAVVPAVAAIVYCLEPVFATGWSVALRTETATAITLVGGALVLLAVVLATRASATKNG
ncbi:MAG: DMT family transporter [Planctomycetes bacterium]|nr:DMT family transporter [Planctomycetota bacterium]